MRDDGLTIFLFGRYQDLLSLVLLGFVGCASCRADHLLIGNPRFGIEKECCYWNIRTP